MNSNISIEKEFSNGLHRFEERVKGSGLVLWARIFKKKLREIVSERESKDKAICVNVNELEAIVDTMGFSEHRQLILEKIQKLKGLVSVFFVAMLCVKVVLISMNVGCCARVFRRGGSQSVTIQRVVHRREALEC